ncbi:MAG: hypothetical protein JNL08_01425 [Planctomycetes bacterium]|nr:hypothetical protein [Planctomycetota bacterium]
MRSPFLSVWTSVALAAFAAAQNPGPLQLRGYDPVTGFEQLSNSTRAPSVEIRYGEQPGEATLLLVHTTVDVSVAGQVVARSVAQVVPSLVAPTWTLANLSLPPQFKKSQANSTALRIPPGRIVRHLQTWLAAGAPAQFGSHNTTTANRTVIWDDPHWDRLEFDYDERQAWMAGNWSYVQSAPVVEVGGVASRAATLAVHEHALANNYSVDPASLDALDTFLHRELGFEVFVQPVHIGMPGIDGKRPIRLGQYATIRRRALLEDQPIGDAGLWHQFWGAERWLPSLFQSQVNTYLGLKGEYMHVLFSSPVVELTAWVPTTYGYVPRLQRDNLNVLGPNTGRVRPEIAIFDLPLDAVSGIVYFSALGPNGLLPITPVGAMSGGALLHAGDMPVW